MPRGKKFNIIDNITDPIINNLKSYNIEQLKQKRKQQESELYSNVSKMVKEANKLMEQQKLEKSRLRAMGFLSIDEAYEEIKKANIPISARAFGGRIERKSIRSEKIGKKRVIAKPVLHDWISLHSNFYSVKKAFEILKQHEPDLNLRAFIGRIEKNSIPSIKINTQRWIPKEVVESLTHVAKNYVDVSQAIALLQANNINIKRNAFERRLDRGRIPHIKLGGRRLISKTVMDFLIKKELELQQKKPKLEPPSSDLKNPLEERIKKEPSS
ncbi:MAG: hypothetical protein NC918_00145 [Candidatus Omnitrophica bacterium]|nr:hypothetical protein [Candidatus Omnitrophota bacterium]